jgi:putative Holliday junction resolvase
VVALGLDVGERRIGVAVGDPTGLLASPLTTVIRTSDRQAVQAIARLAAERHAETLVIGLPLHADDTESAQSARVRAFAGKLRAIPNVRVVFWDERNSTVSAGEYLAAARGRTTRPRSAQQREAQRRRLDAAAAAVMLQDYLDQQRASGPCESPSSSSSSSR